MLYELFGMLRRAVSRPHHARRVVLCAAIDGTVTTRPDPPRPATVL